MNFSSIGATFSVVDKGASAFFGTLAKGVSGVKNSFSSLSDVAGMFAHAATQSGSNLTTAYERMAQEHSVMARKGVAAFGIYGKGLDKATGKVAGLTMGLGISNEAASAGVAAFAKYGDVLKVVGISSGDVAAKLGDTGLVKDVFGFAQSLNSAKKELHATDAELAQMGKTLTGAGKALDNPALAAEKLNEALSLAKNRENLVAQGFSKIKGMKVVDSIYDTAAAFRLMGVNSEEALETAFALEKTLQADAANMRNMFAGVSSEMGQFVQGFSIISGDFESAWQSIEDGPDAFIKKMSTAIVKLRKSGGNVGQLLGHLESQLGKTSLGEKGAAQIIRTLSNVSDANIDAIKSVRLAGDDYGKVTKDVWRSTKTLQDQFDMTMGAGVATFRNIGRAAAVEFVRDAGKAFQEFNKTAAEWAKGDDLKGTIVKKMSEISNIGVAALLPKAWRGGFAVFGEMYKQLSPTLDTVIKLSGAVGALANPLTLVAGLVGLFVSKVVSAKKESKSWGEAMGEAWQSFKTTLGEWTDQLVDWANEIPWESIANSVAEGFASALRTMADVLSDADAALNDPSSGKVGQLASRIFKAFKNAFDGYDWGSLFKNLWDKSEKVREDVQKKIVEFLKATLGSMTQSDWEWVGQKVAAGLGWAVNAAKTILQSNAEFTDAVADVFKSAVKVGLEAAVKALFSWDTLKSVLSGLAGGTVGIFRMLWPEDTNKKMNTEVQAMTTDMHEQYRHSMDQMLADTNKYFGNSLVPDAFGKGFDEIKKEVKTLTPVFEGEFKDIDTKSARFLADQTRDFMEFAKRITTLYKSMWMFVLEQTETAVAGVSSSVGASIQELDKLKQALDRVQDAKAIAARVKAGENPHEYKSTGEDTTKQQLQLAAWPLWYENDFRRRYDEGVGRIVAAISSNKILASDTSGAAKAKGRVGASEFNTNVGMDASTKTGPF